MIRQFKVLRPLTILIMCVQSDMCFGETISNVQNVVENLFSPSVYNKEIHGKNDLSESLEVNVSFSLVYIKRLDEKEESIDIFGVLSLEWEDERLVWDPRLYNDTYQVWMTAGKVWRPEVILENQATSRRFFGDISRLKSLHIYNGSAFLTIGDLFECTCSVDLISFPWDKQTCTINLIVSGYLSTEVELTGAQNEINLDSYHSNVYSKSIPTKSLLVFEMVLQRRPTFFVVNLLLPVATLAVLQLFVLKVPIESGERISFSLTVLLSITVYMTLIGDNLPPSTKSMAALCYLVAFIMIQSALICLFNIVSMSLYHKDSEVCSFWYIFMNMFGKCCSKTRKYNLKSDVREVNDGVDNDKTVSEIHISETINENSITWKELSQVFDRFITIIMATLLCSSFLMFAYYVISG